MLFRSLVISRNEFSQKDILNSSSVYKSIIFHLISCHYLQIYQLAAVAVLNSSQPLQFEVANFFGH